MFAPKNKNKSQPSFFKKTTKNQMNQKKKTKQTWKRDKKHTRLGMTWLERKELNNTEEGFF